MVIPFIALFFYLLLPWEKPSVFLIFHIFYQEFQGDRFLIIHRFKFLIIHRFKSGLDNSKTILGISMNRKKITYNWNELQKVTLTNIREKNLMSRKQQHNCFNKNEIGIYWNRFVFKNLVFVPWFRKQKSSLVSWLWGRWEKLYCEKWKMHHISQITIY